MRNLFMLVLATMPFAIHAQEKKLIENYKFRIPQYKAIVLNGSLWSRNFRNNDSSTTNANINLFPSLEIRKSTDKVIQSYGISYQGNYSFASSKQNQNKFKSSSLSTTAIPYFNYRRYFEKKFYVETNVIVGGGLGRDKSGNNSQQSNIGQYFSNTIVGVGKGRIENVTDIQNAIWLHRNLKNAKLISRALTDGEINDLARALTQARNVRLLDSRRFIKNILKSAHEHLQTTGALVQNNIDYFNTLNDILFYAGNNYRASGKEFYIKAGPAIGFSKQEVNTPAMSTINTTNNKNGFLQASAGYRSFKPLSLTRQLNWNIGIAAVSGRASIKSKEMQNNILQQQTDFSEKVKNFFISGGAEYGIYPNTRTSIFVGVNFLNGATITNGYSQPTSNNNLYLDLNYCLSYNTIIKATAKAIHSKNNVASYDNSFYYGDGFHFFTDIGIAINL